MLNIVASSELLATFVLSILEFSLYKYRGRYKKYISFIKRCVKSLELVIHRSCRIMVSDVKVLVTTFFTLLVSSFYLTATVKSNVRN